MRNVGLKNILAVFMLASLVGGCATVDPHQLDVKLEESKPAEKVTSYSLALVDLGMMTEVYGAPVLKIQSEDIADNTGTSSATGGEIQRNITEIIKSTLNSIGGNVVFIEYNPAYIQNQMVTGYSNFDERMIPDVVITGGITEFDRGLETYGDGTDIGAEASFTGAADWLPSKTVGVEYSDAGKTGKARITLDFNLKNFKTLAGIPRMNTINSMEVHKATREKEVGITLFGPTFGSKGSVKKVQGRHEAVRLLVQVSMMQMVGKYLILPYWRLLGDDAKADDVVMTALKKRFYRMTEPEKIANVQEWLFLHGYDVQPTGRLDGQTGQALSQFDPGYAAGSPVSEDLFARLYLSVPINEKTVGRRALYARQFGGQTMAPAAASTAPQNPVSVAAEPAAAPQQRQTAQQQPAPAAAAAPAPAPAAAPAARGGAIGRFLDESDW